jgi:hypothetical protein
MIRPFQIKVYFKTAVQYTLLPQLRITALSGRAIITRYSVTVYCLCVFTPSPGLCAAFVAGCRSRCPFNGPDLFTCFGSFHSTTNGKELIPILAKLLIE